MKRLRLFVLMAKVDWRIINLDKELSFFSKFQYFLLNKKNFSPAKKKLTSFLLVYDYSMCFSWLKVAVHDYASNKIF